MRQKHRYRLIAALTARIPSPIWVLCAIHHNLSGFLNLTDPLAVQQFIYTASIWASGIWLVGHGAYNIVVHGGSAVSAYYVFSHIPQMRVQVTRYLLKNPHGGGRARAARKHEQRDCM